MTKRQRTCSDCPAPITHRSKTGRCRPCAIAIIHADPEYQERRRAGLARYFDTPGAREACAERFRDYRRNMPPEERARLREHGRWLYREHAPRPEVRERAFSAEARAKAGAACSETVMGWCPAELRPMYDDLVLKKKIPAAEARQLVEAHIPRTREHARLEVANFELASRLRHERDLAQAY